MLKLDATARKEQRARMLIKIIDLTARRRAVREMQEALREMDDILALELALMESTLKPHQSPASAKTRLRRARQSRKPRKT